MTNSSSSSIQDSNVSHQDLTWSRSEKAFARKACDAALGRKLYEVLQEAKRMASQIKQPPDLWDLEHRLTEPRKEIDGKCDYRTGISR